MCVVRVFVISLGSVRLVLLLLLLSWLLLSLLLLLCVYAGYTCR